LFSAPDYEDVDRYFDSRPELTPTPLVALPSLAASAGLSNILLKDEAQRFGTGAFKIVGTLYAVDRLLRERDVDVFVCATEGNHGRAVARVAREYGRRAIVYIRASAAPFRVDAIRREGADIVLVDGTYDDAVRRMAREAASIARAEIVSDTAWPGYEAIPRAIMLGYTRILSEASRQWGASPPDLVVVQAGVGALAGAVAAWLRDRFDRARRPRLVCAEPVTAACVGASLRAGHPATVAPGDTAMAGLRAGEISSIAFEPLADVVNDCVTVNDAEVFAAIERLAAPLGDDPVVYAGPSGACGLAALLRRNEEGGGRVWAAPGCRALVINTEGADPARYARDAAPTDSATRPDARR
jgi:diaminopropionate ammonia-lyase